MEYFRFSQIEIKKDPHLYINIIGEEFNSSDDFFNKYKTINESTGVENDCVLLESING